MQNNYNSNNPYEFSFDQAKVMPSMEDDMDCSLCYPEIYYKVQPFVMSVCDQMDYGNRKMLNQEMFYQLSDNIYQDVCAMYPDVLEYVSCHDMRSSVESAQRDMDFDFFRRDMDFDRFDRRGRGFFPFRRFRRRGLFLDFIDFLLLTELFRRGRRF